MGTKFVPMQLFTPPPDSIIGASQLYLGASNSLASALAADEA